MVQVRRPQPIGKPAAIAKPITVPKQQVDKLVEAVGPTIATELLEGHIGITPVPPPSKPSPWSAKEITALDVHDVPFKVSDAKVMGGMAVYPSKDPNPIHEGKWTLTHVYTGLLITRLNTEDDALKLGEFLWSKMSMVWRERDQATLLASIPEWVKNWIFECRDRGTFEAPKR